MIFFSVVKSAIARYREIISSTRERPTTVPGRTLLEEISSDRSRVLYSSAFRRLQQKAQVFSLVENAAVRSRLTHSLEVADVGWLIGQSVGSHLVKRRLLNSDLELPFAQVVETACLMHDIGNPPFGHFGETAIRKWFGENWKDCFHESLTRAGIEDSSRWSKAENECLHDFTEFDGNPQGFRIVTRLQRSKKESGGLNLTYTQLLTFLKYLRSTNEEGDTGLRKKPGYFQSETDVVDRARRSLGVDPAARFPFTYLMEAADDIAYCISDIEDGIESGVLSQSDFCTDLFEEWPTPVKDSPLTDLHQKMGALAKAHSDDWSEFFEFKTDFTRTFIKRAAEWYIEQHEAIMDGTLVEIFPPQSDEAALLASLKTVARKRLFRSFAAEKIELAGYEIITGLLDRYRPLLVCGAAEFQLLFKARNSPTDIYGKGLDLELRLFNRLPPHYRLAYREQLASTTDPGFESFLRAHLIIDYIAGMTDDFALRTFQLLAGVRVG